MPLRQIEDSLPGTLKFDTDFPSFCFDLATGVGKTRLLAGAIAYLHRTGVSNNFFILTPGKTIYDKYCREVIRTDPKYMFKGLAGFPTFDVVTADDFLYRGKAKSGAAPEFTVYIFNIQKLLRRSASRSEVHSFREDFGESFVERLRGSGDLVLLMDESHRYRGPDFMAAMNELKPRLGLEFTATPAYRKNVLLTYTLKEAVSDGYVKKLKAVYRQNDAAYDEELDQLKLTDGLRVHETVKARLRAHAANTGTDPVTPIAFISARTIEHAKSVELALSDKRFEGGRYAGRVLTIHSKSDEEDEERLVALDQPGNATEIVVHVTRLKEGWDIQRIFTIIPLRASISEILTAQTLGRGVRLPFGVGNRSELHDESIATLNVICYQKGKDNYKRIVDSSEQLGLVETEDASETKREAVVQVGLRKKLPKIEIPLIESEIKSQVSLPYFEPVVGLDEPRQGTTLVGVDVTSGEAELIEAEAAATSIGDLLGYTTAWFVDQVDELVPDDVPIVKKIVESYLQKATKASSHAAWVKYLKEKRRWVREDLKRQIVEHLRDKTRVKYTVLDTQVEFKPFQTTLPEDKTDVRDYKSVPDSEITKSLVGGYTKTPFEGYRFDSQQEKWLADALERDKEVPAWVRVPEGQMPIRTRFGNYQPDFVVVTKSGMLVVEVKLEKFVEDREPALVEKAKRATEWCAKVSAYSKRDCQYKLIRHTRVKAGDTLNGMLSRAESIKEFLAGKTTGAPESSETKEQSRRGSRAT